MNVKILALAHLFIFFSLISVGSTEAEVKTLVGEYTYKASPVDTKESCQIIALEQVKRLLLEELGTYLESFTEVTNYQLTKDKITVLTAGIVQTNIIEEEWNGHTYRLKAKIVADSSEVTKSIDNLRRQHTKTKELEEVRKRSDELLKENERLRKTLEGKHTIQPRFVFEDQPDIFDRIAEEKENYDKTIKELSAIDWFYKGYSLALSGNYIKAIEAFTKAIELNPKFATAFYNRGHLYGDIGKYNEEIRDYNRAIAINPKDAEAYNNRGIAYGKLKEYQQEIRNYDKAIELNPNYEDAFINRGIAYRLLGKYEQAFRDINKAIELNPKSSSSYYTRGLLYGSLNDHQKAIKDFDKAISLNSKHVEAYVFRSVAYIKMGIYDQAIKDTNKALELNPKEAGNYYYNMACIYSVMNDSNNACRFLKKAIGHGYSDWEHLKKDDDFNNIRNSSCFQEIVREF
jgi:tetratricopeptide (TPR) repeat protein